jgi:IS30 family transposase
MVTTKKYVGLSDAERSEIEILRSKGYSRRKIAAALGRSPNTISREIKVNTVAGEYVARKAKAKSRLSRKSRRYQWQKIEQHPSLRDFIIERLAPPHDWSPRAISGHLQHWQTKLPYVSTMQIYAWLYSSRGQLYCQYLYSERYHPRRRLANKTERVMIPDRLSITERAAVETRVEAGDWEYDSIVSSKRSQSTYSLAVVQDRATRLVRAGLVPNLRPVPYATVISGLVGGLLVHTLTTDNGIENKAHADITSNTGAAVYFTDPYSSWQKGGVENANKMIRRYFPKGTDFSTVTQAQVDQAISRINNKPRRCLGFKSALQCAVEKGLLLDGVSY